MEWLWISFSVVTGSLLVIALIALLIWIYWEGWK